MGRSRTRVLQVGCAAAAALVSAGISGCGAVGGSGGHSGAAGTVAVTAKAVTDKLASPPKPPAPPRPHAGGLPWEVLVARGPDDVVDGASVSLGDCAAGAVTWINRAHARFELHPGGEEPGGSGWAEPDYVPDGRRTGLAATFNGGFRMVDSGGAFYLNGQQAGTLNNGMASEFFSSTGGFSVGSYGRDGAAGGQTTGVRQNLNMLVDAGAPTALTDSLSPWGASWGGATCVRRSGVGVDAAGNAVYATGSDLSPRGLAQLLVAAGAVRGMQLDINPNWPSFMYYDQAGSPHMYGDSAQSPDRYLSPTDRDFVAVYAK